MLNAKRLMLVVLPGLLSVANALAANFTITIDATALTNTGFVLQGPPGTPCNVTYCNGQVPETLSLPAGNYLFQPGSGMVMACSFSVNAPGVVDYSATCDGFLSGRGTNTLVIRGFRINIDATALSETAIYMASLAGATELPSAIVQPMTLVATNADEYAIQPGGGLVANFAFGIDTNGNITYGAAFDSFLSGRGTNTLTIHGFTINIDAHPLSATSFLLPGLFGLESTLQASSVVQTYRVMPASSYGFQTGGGEITNMVWGVDLNGLVTYSASSAPYLAGAGTKTLHVNGYPVFIDATAFGPSGLFEFIPIIGVGALSTATVQSLTLLPTPGFEYLGVIPPMTFIVVLQDSGTWTYDPSLDSCVAGRGTNRLIVFCNPASPPTCEQLISSLEAEIQHLPASAFKNSNTNLAGALINKLNAVLSDLGNAKSQANPARGKSLQGILNNLNNDILAKTDGCAATGSPDANDWIVDCSAQASLGALLQRIIICIGGMMTAP